MSAPQTSDQPAREPDPRGGGVRAADGEPPQASGGPGTAATSASGRVARTFVQLASGDALARVIAFLGYVYVARELEPALFGVISFAQAVVLYFAHLSVCGIDLPGMRDVAADRRTVAELAPGIMTVRLLVTLVLIVLLACGSLLFLPWPEAGVLAIYALTLLGHGPNARFILLGLERPRPVALARTAGEALFLVLVLTFVRGPEDLGMVPWSQFVGDLLGAALLVWTLRKSGIHLPLRLDWQRVKPVFVRSFPLVINILLGLMIFNVDLLYLWVFGRNEPIGTAAVGWYSAGYTLISFMINLAWTYSFSLLPQLTQASSSERPRLYASALAQTFAVTLPVFVGGALLSEAIVTLVFGAQYAPAGRPLALLLGTVPLLLFTDTGIVALIIARREATVMKLTAAALAFNLVTNALVIPRYGMVGAAATTLATEALRAALMSLAIRREGYTFVTPRRLLPSALAAGVMGVALWLLGPVSPSVLPVFAAIAAGAVVYALALMAAGGLRVSRGRAELRV